MKNWKLSPWSRGLLAVQLGLVLGGSALYLLTGRLDAGVRGAPLYVLGTGAAVLGAVCVLFPQEIFTKKRRAEDGDEPAAPGRGARFAPRLTQTAFTLAAALCYAAGLLS